MPVAFIVFFVMFSLLAVITFKGKLTSFITGDQTDDNGDLVYDHEAINKFLGTIMCLLAVSALMGILGFVIPKANWLIIVAPILFIAVLLFALIYVNTDNRFKKNKGNKREKK